jgi:hypothetical protein
MTFRCRRFGVGNRVCLAGAIVLLVACVALVATAQHNTRDGITKRFAAGTQQFTSFVSVGMSTTIQAHAAEAEQSLTARRLEPADLRRFRDTENLRHRIVVLDQDGRVLASLDNRRPSTRLVAQHYVREALRGRPGVSGVLTSKRGPSVELAIPFQTPSGRRVVTDSVPLDEIGAFLQSLSALTVIPGSRAFVIDQAGTVLTGSAGNGRPGQREVQSALLKALRTKSTGTVSVSGDAAHFFSYPIPNTEWRLVLTAPDAQLYATVSGANLWLPWALLAGLLAAGLAAAAFLRRIERSNRSLAEAHGVIAAHSEELEEAVRARTHELELSRLETLQKLALASEYRDDDTHQHTERVGVMAGLLAAEMGMPADYLALIRRAAPLHDVGKMAVSDSILLSPGKLSDEEFRKMQCHSEVGALILGNSSYDVLVMGAEIAGSHHERWDGTGYPSGLAGEDIPLSGRITSVADVFDALIQERPYKRAWPVDQAVQEIRCNAGTQFDPRVVSAFLALDSAQLALPAEAHPGRHKDAEAELHLWIDDSHHVLA